MNSKEQFEYRNKHPQQAGEGEYNYDARLVRMRDWDARAALNKAETALKYAALAYGAASSDPATRDLAWVSLADSSTSYAKATDRLRAVQKDSKELGPTPVILNVEA